MKLRVNGSDMELSHGAAMCDLLNQLGLGGKPVVVELNQRALYLREHAETKLNEGDVVEVVQITAGG